MSSMTMNPLKPEPLRGLRWALMGLGVLAIAGLLGLVVMLHGSRLPVAAALTLLLATVLALTLLSRRAFAWRYLLPGLLAVVLFIVVPVAFTLRISLTNYSAEHLLSFERATEVLLSRTDTAGTGMDLQVLPVDDSARTLRLRLQDDAGRHWTTEPITLPPASAAPGSHAVTLHPVDGQGAAPASDPDPVALDARRLVHLLPALQALDLLTPDGRHYRLASLHRVTDQQPLYQALSATELRDLRTGTRVSADMDEGWWRTADGQRLEPGFRAEVGLANYRRIFTDPDLVQPFGRAFAWTVSFATLNTLFTFALGGLLAVGLNWESLRGRGVYRMLLFLPYAVPAFISIPVFRGLFNENLGEINAVLHLLFDIRPGWFSDATLARSMVLIVNTWLGYPYMMILVMGLLKAIPAELYEASALAGVGPVRNLLRITLPLIARPMAPLLIASFAANFNNLTLIALLTEGAPDYLDTVVPVGATDLLASYTYRIAFHDGGQNYALACAISAIVFVIVAALALINLRLFRQKPAQQPA